MQYTPVMSAQRAKRFYEQVSAGPADCQNWTGALTSSGHGIFSVAGQSHPVHRLAYVYERGMIEYGMEIDHLCANKRCVNPDHLEVVDRSTNVTRAHERAALSSIVLLNRTLKRQGRSKTWLAAELGISRQAISQWQEIPADRLHDIAALLGVSPERLTTSEPTQPNPQAARNIGMALHAAGRSKSWLAKMLGIRREALYARFSNGFTEDEQIAVADIMNVPRSWLFPDTSVGLAGLKCEQENS